MSEFQNPRTETIVQFLRTIGLALQKSELDGETVLPGIRIESGVMLVDEEKLTYPCDLLHEAGHLAIATPAERGLISDNYVTAEDQSPEVSEVVAIAWSYAATVHLGIDPRELFHAGGYHGQSEGLLMTYNSGMHLGAHGLVAFGMTSSQKQVNPEGILPYPAMAKWLRE